MITGLTKHFMFHIRWFLQAYLDFYILISSQPLFVLNSYLMVFIIIIIIIFVCLLGTSETSLCSTFALQLKTVLLLDVLQLLMLSAETLMSLEIIMFPLNTFYCKQNLI
jgi:hypothetical protein